MVREVKRIKKIKIKGRIVANGEKWIYDWFGIDATCEKDVTDVLDDMSGEDIELDISSPGGDVWAGSDIYTALKSYAGRVFVNVTAVAASAASIIAMAGDVVNISPTAQIMIHNVMNAARGDYRTLQHAADVVKNYNTSISNAYRLKTGLSESELLEMMNTETWLTAQQAKEKGFADNIMFDDDLKLVASASYSDAIPQAIIEKMQNERLQNKSREVLEARMSILKMGGTVNV